MGWLFSMFDTGRQAHIEKLTSQQHFSPGYTPLEHRVVGNRVWQLVQQPDGKKFITLDLIAKERNGGWGYKGLSEDMGPCYYDCPLSLLRKADETDSKYATEWRLKVHEYHARRKAKPKLKAGVFVRYGTHQYRLVEPAGPRRGWFVKRVDSGATYRMTARQLSQATFGSEA